MTPICDHFAQLFVQLFGVLRSHLGWARHLLQLTLGRRLLLRLQFLLLTRAIRLLGIVGIILLLLECHLHGCGVHETVGRLLHLPRLLILIHLHLVLLQLSHLVLLELLVLLHLVLHVVVLI